MASPISLPISLPAPVRASVLAADRTVPRPRAPGHGGSRSRMVGLLLAACTASCAPAQTIKLSWTLYDSAFNIVPNFTTVEAGTVYAVLTARITETDALPVVGEQVYVTSTYWAGHAEVTPDDPQMDFYSSLGTAVYWFETGNWALGGPRAVRWVTDSPRTVDLGYFELAHDGGLTVLSATLEEIDLQISDCPFDTGCDIIGRPPDTVFDESAFTIINPGLAGFGVPTPAAAGIAAIAGVHASRRRR